jgi:hypothetical protein
MMMAFGFGTTAVVFAARPTVLEETRSKKTWFIEELPESGEGLPFVGCLGTFYRIAKVRHTDILHDISLPTQEAEKDGCEKSNLAVGVGKGRIIVVLGGAKNCLGLQGCFLV